MVLQQDVRKLAGELVSVADGLVAENRIKTKGYLVLGRTDGWVRKESVAPTLTVVLHVTGALGCNSLGFPRAKVPENEGNFGCQITVDSFCSGPSNSFRLKG